MIVCVDGTGVYSDIQYRKDMANSFCTQIVEQKGTARAAYFEGPGGFGLTTRGKANRALSLIRSYYADPRIIRSSPLFLAGYSRGGACVLQIAKWLAEESPLRVKALFLIDPVNRDINLNTDNLGTPSNVDTVYVILRDQTIEHVDTGDDFDIYARKWMGTCYWTPQNATRTKVGFAEIIRGASHGAAGGCAWREREADRFGEAAAAKTLNRAFHQEGLNVTLTARTFPPLNLPKVTPIVVKLR